MEIRSDPDTSYFRGSDSDPVVLEGDIRFFLRRSDMDAVILSKVVLAFHRGRIRFLFHK